MRIIIDGYNLLPEWGSDSREDLIQTLVQYKKEKAHQIQIIFDGTHGGFGDYSHSKSGSVEVIFTPLTVQADDYIEDFLEKGGGQDVMVISSDRRLQKAARKAKSFWASSQEFSKKLARRSADGGSDEVPPWLEGREEVFEVPKKGTRKKGAARRPSQEERRRLKKLEQL